MQTSIHWEMLHLSQKVLPTALSQWMLNMTADLCSSPRSLLLTFVQEYRFHLYSWLQLPLRDGCHQKNHFHHPSQQYSGAVFKDVTVQARNLILLHVELCSMFNIVTRFNSPSNPSKNTHRLPGQRFG